MNIVTHSSNSLCKVNIVNMDILIFFTYDWAILAHLNQLQTLGERLQVFSEQECFCTKCVI